MKSPLPIEQDYFMYMKVKTKKSKWLQKVHESEHKEV